MMDQLPKAPALYVLYRGWFLEFGFSCFSLFGTGTLEETIGHSHLRPQRPGADLGLEGPRHRMADLLRLMTLGYGARRITGK